MTPARAVNEIMDIHLHNLDIMVTEDCGYTYFIISEPISELCHIMRAMVDLEHELSF